MSCSGQQGESKPKLRYVVDPLGFLPLWKQFDITSGIASHLASVCKISLNNLTPNQQ